MTSVILRPDPGEYFKNASVAEAYDDYIGKNIPYYWGTIERIAQFVGHRYSRAGSVVSALEFGSGTGNLSLSLLETAGVDRVLMIDHSAAMLKRAREKAERRGLSPSRLGALEAAILDTAWEDVPGYERPAIALFHLSLDHVEYDDDLARLLSRLYRHLPPGGCLVIAEKCADGRNRASKSWASFAKMIDVRAADLSRRGYLNPDQVERWKHHILGEDVLRPLGQLWSRAQDAGFEISKAWGVPLPPADQLDDDYYYGGGWTYQSLDERPSDDIAFGIGVLVCMKQS